MANGDGGEPDVAMARRPGTMTLVVGSGIGAAIVGAGFTFLVQQITVPTQLNEQAAQIADLKARFDAMDARDNAERAQLVSTRMALREIETQFRAEDAINNLQHAHDQRDFAVLWLKVMGTPFPLANAYYPAVGQQPDGESK